MALQGSVSVVFALRFSIALHYILSVVFSFALRGAVFLALFSVALCLSVALRSLLSVGWRCVALRCVLSVAWRLSVAVRYILRVCVASCWILITG